MNRITKNQKGFSLVELLVVVIIIAIVAAIAIPSLLASRRAANEASAISSLRTIHSAQSTFFATLGGNSAYAADLAALGPAGGGPALIDATLAGGAKSGYTFASTSGAVGFYCATGNANSYGTLGTGDRGFAVSQPGVIYALAGAVPACNNATGAITSGSPIE